MEDTPYFVQYIMATIKVPMIRQPSGKIDSLSDHTTIDFETIRGLPVKPDYKVDNAYIKTKINELLKQKNKEPIREPVQEPIEEEIIVEKPVEGPIEEHIEEPVQEELIVENIEKEIVEKPIDESIEEEAMQESHEEPGEETIEEEIVEEPSYEEKTRIIDESAAEKLRNLGAKFLLNDKKKSSSKKVMKERSPSPEFSMRR